MSFLDLFESTFQSFAILVLTQVTDVEPQFSCPLFNTNILKANYVTGEALTESETQLVSIYSR